MLRYNIPLAHLHGHEIAQLILMREDYPNAVVAFNNRFEKFRDVVASQFVVAPQLIVVIGERFLCDVCAPRVVIERHVRGWLYEKNKVAALRLLIEESHRVAPNVLLYCAVIIAHVRERKDKEGHDQKGAHGQRPQAHHAARGQDKKRWRGRDGVFQEKNRRDEMRNYEGQKNHACKPDEKKENFLSVGERQARIALILAVVDEMRARSTHSFKKKYDWDCCERHEQPSQFVRACYGYPRKPKLVPRRARYPETFTHTQDLTCEHCEPRHE